MALKESAQHPLARVDQLKRFYELEHQVAAISSQGGNREFEQTVGKVKAVEEVMAVMRQKESPAEAPVEALVYERRGKLNLLIGSPAEFEAQLLDAEKKEVRRISGTRLRVYEQFVEMAGKEKARREEWSTPQE